MVTAPAVLLAIFALLLIGWLGLHWRYHIHSTPLDSREGLQNRIGRGRAVLVQFHAPL